MFVARGDRAIGVVAVADPVYPVYVDTNVMAGRTGPFNNGRYSDIYYLEGTRENGFVPDLDGIDAETARLRAELHEGVNVLVKGSRFMQMERVVEALREPQAVSEEA